MNAIIWYLFMALFLASTRLVGQTAPTTPPPADVRQNKFEIVSIHASRPANYPGADGGDSITWAIQPDGYSAKNQTIESTIKIAFFPEESASWMPDLIQGAPSWLSTEQYDITARVSDENLGAWRNQGKSPKGEVVFRQMLQAMLIDRCQFAFHRKSQQVDGLSLVAGSRGALLRPAQTDEMIPADGMAMTGGGTVLNTENGQTLKFYGVTMEDLSSYLATFSFPRQIVQDNTGLHGRYNFTLHRGASMSGDDDANATRSWDLSNIGLEFRKIKVNLDAIVIEHIERPSGN